MATASVGTRGTELAGLAPAGLLRDPSLGMDVLRAAFRLPESRLHGIVLAGSFPWSDSPLDRLRPRPLLPVAHEPLISWVLRWLADSGVADVTVCLDRASRAARAAIAEAQPQGVSLSFYEDAVPRGPAGCARDAALASAAEAFVVVDGNAMPAAVLADVLHTHRAAAALATVLVQQDAPATGSNCLFRPGGLYLFERRALEGVPASGFQDIKENLIPRLYRADEHVAAHRVDGRGARVLNTATYLEANHWAVARRLERPEIAEGYTLRDEALVHRAALVDAGARLVGPVLVGRDCRIQSGATLVGPVVLGEGCRVEADAFVSRTVAWNRCRVGARAVVDGSVLADDTEVAANARLRDAVWAARQELSRRIPRARNAAIPPLWPRAWRTVR